MRGTAPNASMRRHQPVNRSSAARDGINNADNQREYPVTMVNTGNCLGPRTCPNPTGTSIGGNQKSHWATSPATYAVRDAGSGGRYAGRSSATRALNTVIPRLQPTRSAITVAGIVGTSLNCSRIASSNSSTTDPAGARSYRGGPSEATAARTVFRDTPNVRAIVLIGNPSARRSRRISAQSSTANNSLRSSRLG